jgi:type 1 glutamine amidotransferase
MSSAVLVRAVLAGFLFAGAALTQPLPIRTLILSGAENHERRITTPRIREILEESGRFEMRLEEQPAGITPATLAGFDLLLVDYNGPRWGAATESAVADFVKSGKGMVIVHGASYPFGGLQELGERHAKTGRAESAWQEYARMAGGTWTEAATQTGHGKRHFFRVKYTDREHPVARGAEESFIATDELYQNMRLRPEAHVLATAFDDDEPILWTVAYGAGRVFNTALGHDLNAMSEPGFVSSLRRGAEWAATGVATLPPVVGPPRKNPKSVRTLVVTGGHDYDPSFYSLFEYSDVNWRHITSAAEAFQKDIRPNFDVLVLYDLTKELPEPQQAHLREFVESGKGVVVLHHAIADYNSWPWWYREVVGGKYLLAAEGTMPGSTFSHDEELFVKPTASHPIVDSVGPMHLWDETYKGMWISPDVRVLLRTDNPTSDGPVAWISPYPKSRVVYIQLGHGRTSHIHPGYRRLVRNAIFWSCGKGQ